MPTTLTTKVRQWLRAQLFRVHGTEADEIVLTQRRVFILPTRAGLAYGVMLIVLLLCSINYSLGLGFALTFLLAACALIDMYLTYRNLVHLNLSSGRSQAIFAGEVAHFTLHLHNRHKRARHALHLGFIDHDSALPEQASDIAGNASTTITLGLHAQQRGWLHAPRVRLHTSFPLGLLRAWSYWQPAARVLVYPMPEAGEPELPYHAGGTVTGHGLAGHDDFAGIRAYQTGDSPRHLAWRQIARKVDGSLVTKQFEGGTHGQLTMDYAQMPAHLDTEQKLARMARWLLMAEARGLSYRFMLGAVQLPSASGPAHLTACLHALAVHESRTGKT